MQFIRAFFFNIIKALRYAAIQLHHFNQQAKLFSYTVDYVGQRAFDPVSRMIQLAEKLRI